MDLASSFGLAFRCFACFDFGIPTIALVTHAQALYLLRGRWRRLVAFGSHDGCHRHAERHGGVSKSSA